MSEDRLGAILGWLDKTDKHDDEDTGMHYRVTLPEVLYETLVSHLRRLRDLADLEGSIASKLARTEPPVNAAIQGTPAAMKEAVARETQKPPRRKVCVVFDGPPGIPDETGGRLVEVEDESGNGVRVGTWRERPDGYWSLDLELAPPESAPYFKCPTCGPRVRADEDHCCVGCGADCTVVGDLTPGVDWDGWARSQEGV